MITVLFANICRVKINNTLLQALQTPPKIIKILKEVEGGRLVKEVCREYGISDATYYNWKSRYGGMSASDLRRMKEMERDLSQYKRMYAELAHENFALKDVIERKL